MRFYWPIAKVDAERRMVWGYASTETEDEQGETVTRQALAAALDDYMRFANIREMHQNSAVGVAKEAEIDDRGLYLAAKIVDDDAWRKVVEGVYKGFSIGGRVTARAADDRSVITGLALTEISVVDRPANPEAVFDCWKRAGAFPVVGGGGSMVDHAAPPAAPAQIWDCGTRGHRHLVKAEAARCIAVAAAGAGAGNAHSGSDAPPAPVDYADPGYQPDGKPRYPIDGERHIRAAWAFIHMPHNARRYTVHQLAEIRARIADAWRAAIDPAGPPAAAAAPEAARKGLAEIGRLAQITLDLQALCDTIADGEGAQRLQEIVAELGDCLATLIAEAADGDDAAPTASPPVDYAAMAIAGALRKGRRGRDPLPDPAAVAAGLATLADAIVPRLDALQRRVEDIAQTPLPPQAAARGFVAGLAKREDGGFAPPAEEDIVAALARMSEEERTLALIKAARQNPVRPRR